MERAALLRAAAGVGASSSKQGTALAEPARKPPRPVDHFYSVLGAALKVCVWPSDGDQRCTPNTSQNNGRSAHPFALCVSR